VLDHGFLELLSDLFIEVVMASGRTKYQYVQTQVLSSILSTAVNSDRILCVN
jgi:hypothetical protein